LRGKSTAQFLANIDNIDFSQLAEEKMTVPDNNLEVQIKMLKSEIEFLRGNVLALSIIIAHIPETKGINVESVEKCLDVIYGQSSANENSKRGAANIVENLFEVVKRVN
jgi:hypothetical protein